MTIRFLRVRGTSQFVCKVKLVHIVELRKVEFFAVLQFVSTFQLVRVVEFCKVELIRRVQQLGGVFQFSSEAHG